jgi:hypothetical protein
MATEEVALNFSGNFAAQAQKDAAAANTLGLALGKLATAREKQTKTPMVDALAGSSGYGKLSAAVSKIFGDAAGAKLDGAAAKLAVGADKLGVTPGMLSAAGGALAGAGGAVLAGGKVVLEAAAALAVAAAGVVAAGVKFGVEQTDAADVQKKIFSKIGDGKGYGLAVKVAADLGIPEDAAIAKTKALLNAKIKSDQVETVIKVGIGLDEVQGAGAGDKFAKTLEKIKNGGKFDSASMKQFAKEGLSADEIYANLAKTLGISVAEAKAKVKSGTLDVDKGIAGVLDVASKKFGGVADAMANSIPGLIGKIKVKFADLFKGFDLGPIKGFLKNVGSVLDGPEGKAMGKAFTELGNTIIKTLFGPLDGTGGKDKLKSIAVFITGVIKGITAGINAAKPYVAKAIDFFKDLFAPKQGSNGPGAMLREQAKFLMAVASAAGIALKPIVAFYQATLPLVKVVGSAAFAVFGAGIKLAGAALNLVIGPAKAAMGAIRGLLTFLGISGGAAGKAGKGIGDNIGQGLLNGIKAKVGAVVAAAGAMAGAALAKIKSLLGVASPAKALVFVGDMMGQGMAKGMNDNAGPQKAAAKMASGAAAAAASGSGAGGKSSGGAAAGGGMPPINIVNHFGAGTTPAQGAAVAKANAEEWKAQMRSWQREQQEGRAA